MSTTVSKIAYKLYFNERLKQVSWNNEMHHPIYIRIVHQRKSLHFKSLYFDLLKNPKYTLSEGGYTKRPKIEDVVKKEGELLEFTIARLKSRFDLSQFQEEYYFLGTDLCNLMEAHFNEYIKTFFEDEGMPFLGRSIFSGNKQMNIFQVIQDLGLSMKKELYEKLIKNSYTLAPPYLEIYDFVKEYMGWPIIFSIRDWMDINNQAKFSEYILKHRNNALKGEIIENIENFIKNIKPSCT